MTTNFITGLLREHNIATRWNGDRLGAYEDCVYSDDSGTQHDVGQWVGIICRDAAGKPIASSSIVFYGSEEDVALSIRLYNEVRTAVIALAHMKYGGAFRGDGCAYAEGFVDGLKKKEQDRRLAEEDEARRNITNGNGSTGMILIQRRNDLISKKETAAKNWLASPAGGGIKLSLASRSRSGASRDARGAGLADGRRYNANAARQKKLN